MPADWISELEQLQKAAKAEIASGGSSRHCWLNWTVAIQGRAPRLIAIAKAAKELRRLRSADGLTERELWDAVDAKLLELDGLVQGDRTGSVMQEGEGQ